ncbi:MAG: pyruvate kinase [Myxococcota bacterium]|nr:pyruvate kinase [Myxococcota bacterium]
MQLPDHKTKIVATIGPASASPEMLERLVAAGMDVARLNLSHGNLDSHARAIERLRAAARTVGRPLAILADLPGPKLRIGQLAREPIDLHAGDTFFLTTDDRIGDESGASVSFARLPEVVQAGTTCFLNDGLIRLEVERVDGRTVHCRVLAGGELRSGKGLNLPGVDLGLAAFTDRDREGLRFVLTEGVDAVSQSFVESAADIEAMRAAAGEWGHQLFVIAKIERAGALLRIGEILAAADGLMIARGDLGVEIPIEEIALVQKRLIQRANLAGKPVITATQMLESMTQSPRPTRAEATDVANAILDGSDAVMLSGESAIGRYPAEAVAMLARIARSIERLRPARAVRDALRDRPREEGAPLFDLIAISVDTLLERAAPAAVFVPTIGGTTARRIARFRPAPWVVAVSSSDAACQRLLFSWGVWPVPVAERPDDWRAFARTWLREHEIDGTLALVTEGPSPKYPDANERIEILDLRREEARA